MNKQTQQVLIRAAVYCTIISFLIGQTVPVSMDHPVNDFIMQLHTKNKINDIHLGSRPFTVRQIISVIAELNAIQSKLSTSEKVLLQRFSKEFTVDQIESGIHGPWQSKQISAAIKNMFTPFDINHVESRFVTFHDENLLLWSDWEEKFSFDYQDSISRSFYQDRVTIAGKFGKELSFYSRYTLFRVGHRDNYPYPVEYKQGYALLEENTDWLVWDISEASLHWDNAMLNIELSKIPVFWGFSKKHSPILSANVQPFTFFRISKTYKGIRAQSLLGSLIPFGENPDSTRQEKHIAAHRFEFDISSDLTVAFSELVIYAQRNLELGYLLPVNLFWSEEHGLGNRDNVLMSFDAFWNVKPGLSIYGTFFWDELSWFKLFKPWWGNKFIFQTGIYSVPFSDPKLPDFRLEYTVSRPWVYTHQDSLLTFTSAEHGLGFPLGPNSQLLYLEMNLWPTFKTFLSFNASYLKKGSGIGSDANDDYSKRDKTMDNNTPILIGDVKESLYAGIRINHRLTELLFVESNLVYNVSEQSIVGKIGLLINY